MVEVAAYCEGPTEWFVLYQLIKRNILEEGKIVGNRDDIRRWLKKPQSIEEIDLNNLPNTVKRILLIFDQEQEESPYNIKSILEGRFNELRLDAVEEHSNVFLGHYKGKHIALFVSNTASPDSNKDFDGYLVQLIEKLGNAAAKLWFENARSGSKDDDRLPAYLRELREKNEVGYQVIHSLGINDIPNTMRGKRWPIQRSKTKLYAYITALQLNKSHVWFAEKLVKWAPEDALRQVFASLIYAWNRLINMEGHVHEP